MLTSHEGVAAIRTIRLELEQNTDNGYPQAALRELLILYDGCCVLGLSTSLMQQVLGTSGWHHIREHLNVPIRLLISRPEIAALIGEDTEVED